MHISWLNCQSMNPELASGALLFLSSTVYRHLHLFPCTGLTELRRLSVHSNGGESDDSYVSQAVHGICPGS